MSQERNVHTVAVLPNQAFKVGISEPDRGPVVIGVNAEQVLLLKLFIHNDFYSSIRIIEKPHGAYRSLFEAEVFPKPFCGGEP